MYQAALKCRSIQFLLALSWRTTPKTKECHLLWRAPLFCLPSVYYTEKIFWACIGFISLAIFLFCLCIELCQAFVQFWGSKNIFSAFLVDLWCFLQVSRREYGLFPRQTRPFHDFKQRTTLFPPFLALRVVSRDVRESYSPVNMIEISCCSKYEWRKRETMVNFMITWQKSSFLIGEFEFEV